MKKIIKLLLIPFILGALFTPVKAAEEESPDFISSPSSTITNVNSYELDESSYISTYQLIPNIGEAGGYTAGQYNWVYKNSGSLNYNCYLYAIGRTSGGKVNPGYYSSSINVKTCSISAFQDAVIADLKALGYSNARLTSANYVPTSGETKIAFRRTYDSNGDFIDFHFMKYNSSTGYWYHKPGLTAILIYKSDATSGSWPSEYYQSGWKYSNFSYTGYVSYVVY